MEARAGEVRYETMTCNNIRRYVVIEKFDAQYARSYGMPRQFGMDGWLVRSSP